jgi:hypothetical protein
MLTRIVRGIAIVVAVARLTFAACDASAAAPCATAEVARADADLVVFQEILRTCWGPDECAAARAVVDSAVERKRAALAVCTPAEEIASKSSPFETTVDPWQSDAPEPAELSPELAAAALALGCEATEEAVQAALLRMLLP